MVDTSVGTGVGERFADALARKDSAAMLDLMQPELDFRGLTPGKFWETSSAEELVHRIMLGQWFPADARTALEDVQTGTVEARQRVSYLLRIEKPEGVYACEQQAYFDVEQDRIAWLRIVCSGYQKR